MRRTVQLHTAPAGGRYHAESADNAADRATIAESRGEWMDAAALWMSARAGCLDAETRRLYLSNESRCRLTHLRTKSAGVS